MVVLEKHIPSLMSIYTEFENVLGDVFNDSAQPFLKTRYGYSEAITATNKAVSACTVTNIGSTGYTSQTSPDYINTAIDLPTNTVNIRDTIKHSFMYYDEFVEWALWLCKKDIPTPYKNRISNTCHAIFITGNSVFIRFPNNIGIMIAMDDDGEFDLSIIFFTSYNNSEWFIKHSDEYQKALNSFNWIISDRTTIF